ncbi:MAG TPA: zf-HC2 domain-containing protein [Myxococcota bacterium]|jgi:anti-sigma factor RsiW
MGSLLSPYADEELAAEESATVRAHVAGCAACGARVDEIRAWKSAIKSAGAPPALPPALADALAADLQSASRKQRMVPAAVLGVAVVAAIVATAWLASPSSRAAAALPSTPAAALPANLAASAAERHRLDLPVDVASPDPARVQEFFAARVPLAAGHAVRVPRLDIVGFGLTGGRVVDVGNHRGAQLVYTGGYGQRLSVLALPDPDGSLAASAARTSRDGALAVRTVTADGAVYTLVGDVDDARIERAATIIER